MTEASIMTSDRAQGGVRLAPDLDRIALFLDFDGTLVDLADTPDGIAVAPGLGPALRRVRRLSQGRVALVSGRSVATLADLLPDFDGTLYGTHGAERRHDGTTEQLFGAPVALTKAVEDAREFAASDPRLTFERKPTGLCIHYRQAPDMAASVHDMITELAARDPGFKLQPAKMAAELALARSGKDTAIQDALSLPGWRGAVPWHIGDDATDEDAFDFVQARGGTGIKVGKGKTLARHRLDAPADVLALLHQWGRGPQ